MVNEVIHCLRCHEIACFQSFCLQQPLGALARFQVASRFCVGGGAGWQGTSRGQAPHILEEALANLGRRSLHISLQAGAPSDERILNKV